MIVMSPVLLHLFTSSDLRVLEEFGMSDESRNVLVVTFEDSAESINAIHNVDSIVKVCIYACARCLRVCVVGAICT